MKRTIALLFALLILSAVSVPAFALDGNPPPADTSILSISDVYQAVKNIVVPKEDYFYHKLDHINDLVNEKFAGLGHLYLMIHQFFTRLNNPQPASLSITLKDNFFYDGYQGMTFDFLSVAAPYISFFRLVTSAACCILTAIACYHKLRTIFRE